MGSFLRRDNLRNFFASSATITRSTHDAANIHDYSGHPFQVQLSRDLAARGHDVLHGYSTQYVTGHGNLEVGPHDSPTLRIEGITAEAEMVKYSPVGRMRFEMSYAQAWQRALDEQSHDVVVTCNVPMFALARMRRYFERRNQRWVLWHQDVHSLGVAAEADRKLPGPAGWCHRPAGPAGRSCSGPLGGCGRGHR